MRYKDELIKSMEWLGKKDDVLFFNTWGGGGWGDPFKRPAEKVAKDVERGLVSFDGAKRYGVVLNKDGSVDNDSTEDLRKKLTNERGDVKLFDFGFTSIDELKARCKAETSFDPPKAPVFQKWHQVAAQKLREAAE